MSNLFSFIQPGLCHFRKAPHKGKQDIGISPGGPMDRLAAFCGQVLLGLRDYTSSLEIILPPRIKCEKPFYFVLTGAQREVVLKHGCQKISVPHGEVVLARRGAEIWFSHNDTGFRTYFSYREYSALEEDTPRGRKRGDFFTTFTFFDPHGFIRLLPGPEMHFLSDVKRFLSIPWRISSDSDDMGCRLIGPELNTESNLSMISDSVNDGTVQMTPGGPIVLLYHRQTVGGYPRIFNVISPDLDLLSQFAPGEVVHFKLINFDESQRINKEKKRNIELFSAQFPFL